MSDFGALLSRLVSHGVPAEDAAQILHDAVTIGVNTVQFRNPEIEKLEERRARDRARKAQDRRVSVEIRGIPQTSVDGRSAKEIPPTPPKENTNPLSPTGTVPRGQHALPQDFTISEEVYAYAAKHSLSRAEADDCAEAMRNWAWGKAIRRADWNRTLYNFFRDAAAKRSKPIPFRGTRNANSSDAVNFAFTEARRLADAEQSLPAIGRDAEGGVGGGLLPRTGTG